jgi:hypothetical protein
VLDYIYPEEERRFFNDCEHYPLGGGDQVARQAGRGERSAAVIGRGRHPVGVPLVHLAGVNPARGGGAGPAGGSDDVGAGGDGAAGGGCAPFLGVGWAWRGSWEDTDRGIELPLRRCDGGRTR